MPSSALLARLPSLRHFVEVAEQGSFRAAAERMNIAPSAVSKQIRNLEGSLGVTLFRRERGRGGLELTEAGEVLLYRCASVMNELTIARDELSQIKGLERGHLRLGVNEVLASDLLPGILSDMNRNHPNLQFTVLVENTPALLRSLQDGDIDIALGYNFPPSAELDTLAVLNRRTYLITAMSHPLARRRKVRIEDLAGEKVIFPQATVMLHRMMRDWLDQSGVEVREVLSTNSFTLLRRLVQDGMGVSIVIGRFLQRTPEQIAFIELDHPAVMPMPLSCCRVAGRTPTASSAAFAAAVRTLFAQYGG
ncbi:LysR family transcriptional regulator [Mangrovicoccus ximenensis]|uniref:LysR family transcriptional regulator n=1 Tax=Mangrovicoccus ximenensis TaxID=1911570 RepID=UPI000D334D80|nr:LysR family transcriptional regulator [Mangrovicoccus ximenensis]